MLNNNLQTLILCITYLFTVIPQALGMEVIMKPGVGPFFPSPITCDDDLDKLDVGCDVSQKLDYVFKAISLTRMKLEGIYLINNHGVCLFRHA